VGRGTPTACLLEESVHWSALLREGLAIRPHATRPSARITSSLGALGAIDGGRHAGRGANGSVKVGDLLVPPSTRCRPSLLIPRSGRSPRSPGAFPSRRRSRSSHRVKAALHWSGPLWSTIRRQQQTRGTKEHLFSWHLRSAEDRAICPQAIEPSRGLLCLSLPFDVSSREDP